jgi:putative tryptophan/tyrosine transport system substrate-binding protein
MMDRRACIVGGMAALAAPLAAEAQQATMPKLCFLAYDSLSSPSWAQRYRTFVEGLHHLGYVDRRNITLHVQSADGDYDGFPALAAECVRLEPNIIVAYNVSIASRRSDVR